MVAQNHLSQLVSNCKAENEWKRKIKKKLFKFFFEKKKKCKKIEK